VSNRKLWIGRVGLATAAIVIATAVWLFPTRNQPEKQTSASQRITASGKTVAVLPFESLSDNKSDAYFADGVQDEILNNLAAIGELKVISRTSVMQYRADVQRDLRQIAGALGVAHVLEGTVRRNGNRVRVSTKRQYGMGRELRP
jgi:TolB-like protein